MLMTMTRLLGISLAVLFLSLGCDNSTSTGGGSGPTTATTSSGGGSAPEQVRIGYFANLTHAQAVLGVASKDFDNAVAPAKVSTKVFNAGPSLIEALFANEIDVGYVGP